MWQWKDMGGIKNEKEIVSGSWYWVPGAMIMDGFYGSTIMKRIYELHSLIFSAFTG
jgi:hypothetical protein